MAFGICRSFKSIWGIAVTGYATKVPESGIKNLFACYAICFDHEIKRLATISAVEDDPENVQDFYTTNIIEDFIDCCTQIEKQ
jgi:ferritin